MPEDLSPQVRAAREKVTGDLQDADNRQTMAFRDMKAAYDKIGSSNAALSAPQRNALYDALREAQIEYQKYAEQYEEARQRWIEYFQPT